MMCWLRLFESGCVPVLASPTPCRSASANRRRRASRCSLSACWRSSPRPERISISEEISSPAIASLRTSSWSPSAFRSSNFGTSSSVRGSTRPHSSSIPTVRSWEASKTSRAASRSMASGQVEVERVQEVDGRARRMDRDLWRHLQQRLGVVEDDLHARVDQLVGERLGGGGRDGEHADHDVLLLDDRLQVVGMPDGRVADLLAELGRVRVEDRDDAEAVVGEDVARGDRLAEVARAEQRDVVLAARAQDLADLADEAVDVVADAALAELAEPAQVSPDLRGVDVRVLRQLLRGDRLLAHLAGLGEDLQVARKAGGHAEREAIGKWTEAAVTLLGEAAAAGL